MKAMMQGWRGAVAATRPDATVAAVASLPLPIAAASSSSSSLLVPVRLPLSSFTQHRWSSGNQYPKPSPRAPRPRPRQQVQNRTFRGIWAGKHIGFGNQESFSERKTRRTWQPNVHRHRLDSDVLGETLFLPITAAALRTFDKYGGLDRYLLRSPLHRLDLGITRMLRTEMEIKLIDTPGLARALNLEDVLERLKRPEEVHRLRQLIAWRASRGIPPPTIMPDTTLPDQPELHVPIHSVEVRRQAEERAEARRREAAAREDAEEVDDEGHRVPIKAPRNAAEMEPLPRTPRGLRSRHSQRATYEHPFTIPVAKKAYETRYTVEATEGEDQTSQQ